MLRALIYLRLMSLWNWTRSRVRRLRQPKYLAGAIVGGAYFYFFFFRGFAMRAPPGAGGADHAINAVPNAAAMLALDGIRITGAVGALILLTILVFMWIVPTRPAALGFSEAEIAFLFPAPVTRRALIHFRLLSSQLRSLLGAIVMMLFSNRWTFLSGNPLTHALGWWFIFSALNLHFTGASFTLTRIAERGIGTWRRRIIVSAALAAVIGVTWLRLPDALAPQLAGNPRVAEDLARWIVDVTATPPLSWLLWPVQVVLAPFLAHGAQAFAFALAPALLVIVLHYLWVVQTAVSFEDATVEQAGTRAARVAAWRSGNRRIGRTPARARAGPFRLAATGRPEFAFLWKNLLSTWPYFTPRVLLGSALVIGAACLWLDAQPEWRAALPVAGAFALVFSGYTLIVGPQFARQDLRTDLPNTDILKTYPLAGWQIVLGQLLAPAAILTGILWLAILVVALAFQPLQPGVGWLSPTVRLVAAIAAAVNVPALVALQLVVPNAATLLFPGWFQASRGRGGGIEVVGQRMIFFFAQILVMLGALLPPAMLATLLMFIGHWLVGPVGSVVIGAAVMLPVLVAEVWLGVWWLGERFERLDLTSELRP